MAEASCGRAAGTGLLKVLVESRVLHKFESKLFCKKTVLHGTVQPFVEVKVDQLYVVVITDFTKVGVLSTQTLNKIGRAHV